MLTDEASTINDGTFLKEFLGFVKTEMLNPDKTRRATAKDVAEFLHEQLEGYDQKN